MGQVWVKAVGGGCGGGGGGAPHEWGGAMGWFDGGGFGGVVQVGGDQARALREVRGLVRWGGCRGRDRDSTGGWRVGERGESVDRGWEGCYEYYGGRLGGGATIFGSGKDGG